MSLATPLPQSPSGNVARAPHLPSLKSSFTKGAFQHLRSVDLWPPKKQTLDPELGGPAAPCFLLNSCKGLPGATRVRWRESCPSRRHGRPALWNAEWPLILRMLLTRFTALQCSLCWRKRATYLNTRRSLISKQLRWVFFFLLISLYRHTDKISVSEDFSILSVC